MRSIAPSPPRSYDALKELLLARREELPRRLVQVAAFALENPDEIAFGTVASVAAQADVQPSTLIRFAQTLGYAGFSDLQEVFRAQLKSRWPDYRERLEHSGKVSGTVKIDASPKAVLLCKLCSPQQLEEMRAKLVEMNKPESK